MYSLVSVSDTLKIKYMNKGLDELSEEFGLTAIDESLVTVADDDEYALPTGIEDISQIEMFEVSNQVPETDKIVAEVDMKVGDYTIADQPDLPSRISITHDSQGNTDTLGTVTITGTVAGVAGVTEAITPVADSTVYGTKYFSAISAVTGADWVTNGSADHIQVGVMVGRYDYSQYYIDAENSRPMNSNSIYQTYTSAGVKKLVMYPAPDYSGQLIRIRYQKKLTPLSLASLDSEPEFDSRYHDALAAFACYQICANGASPDTTQANRFASEWEEAKGALYRMSARRKIRAPKKKRANRHWYESR